MVDMRRLGAHAKKRVMRSSDRSVPGILTKALRAPPHHHHYILIRAGKNYLHKAQYRITLNEHSFK